MLGRWSNLFSSPKKEEIQPKEILTTTSVKDRDPITVKEKSISLEKFWQHYDSIINSLLSYKNNLNDSNRPPGP